ncbi:DeoR/GlpR family DNA-binding transcription regulator [Bacillus massiliigorillae]|uniref:DeoR/GlpR family DNA-binding transcription regulator n=1 Tax=Bacillus massiliigorillae TaxID=1243664 RepID=UPI00039FE798|nr:DeoR/GlpR family DNA-binding transcription regulator [Bacillus massiliigorillae]
MSVAGEERKKKILEILDEEGKAKVAELAVKLKVTTETIRRYLEELAQEEKLKKVYGGAVKVSFYHDEPSAIEREILYADEKKRIGKKAASLINDNEVIAIDDGSTTMQLAKHLCNKSNVTIITNSVTALSVLMENHYHQYFTGRIIFLGGEINSTHYRTAGAITLDMIDDFFVDKYFIATDGLSIDRGITSYDSTKGLFTRKMIEHADKSFILLDHSKIGHETHFRIADMSVIDTIICDKHSPLNWVNCLEKNKINWIIAEE